VILYQNFPVYSDEEYPESVPPSQSAGDIPYIRDSQISFNQYYAVIPHIALISRNLLHPYIQSLNTCIIPRTEQSTSQATSLLLLSLQSPINQRNLFPSTQTPIMQATKTPNPSMPLPYPLNPSSKSPKLCK